MIDNNFEPNSYLNYENWSSLFIAVKYNQIKIVQILLNSNARIDQLTLNGDV